MTRGIALAIAALTIAVTVRYSTFAAGGSDSYCYVEQAERWAAGTITAPIAGGEAFPWRNVALSLAPTGFIPSPIHDRAIAPICPAGLALAMAIPRVAGLPRVSVFFIVPLCAGLAAWSVFLIARRLTTDWVAVLAVVASVTTPIFLFQGVQPMSDVPAAALWALSLALVGNARRGAFASGLAAGAAVLVRPNLAPLAGIIGLYALLGGRTSRDRGTWPWRERFLDAASFGAGVVPGGVAVAVVNSVLYGSPLSSGYGSLDALFSWSHVGDNLWRYPLWMVSTASPLLLVALGAPWIARDRAYAWMLLAFAAGVAAIYLPYVPFDNWSYLRFLLPGVLPAFALTVATLGNLPDTMPRRRAARMPGAEPVGMQGRTMFVEAPRARAWMLLAPTLLVALWSGWQLSRARALGVFGVARDERRFIMTGRFAADYLAPDALVFTLWQSGSVRYYGSRLTVLWDALDAAELDPAIDALTQQSRDAVLILDAFEREMFRRRFGGASRFADLDWPPVARIGATVTVWRFSDRARYDRGERLETLLVR